MIRIIIIIIILFISNSGAGGTFKFTNLMNFKLDYREINAFG